MEDDERIICVTRLCKNVTSYWRCYFRQNVTRYKKVTLQKRVTIPSTDYDDITNTRHRPASRVWLGTQTADILCDRLKQFKRFMTGAF